MFPCRPFHLSVRIRRRPSHDRAPAQRHDPRPVPHRDQDVRSCGDACRFWCDIIGLREMPRPDFGYPGAWLRVSATGRARHHPCVCGRSRRWVTDGKAPSGTAAIDHISLSCSGFRDYVARFKAAGPRLARISRSGTTLWQLFVYDPSGVQLELTFEGDIEGAQKPDMSLGRGYVAGSSFFDREKYPKLTPPAGSGVSGDRAASAVKPMPELWQLSATDLATAYRDGTTMPVAVLEATLQRIEDINPRLNAIVTLDLEGARAPPPASTRPLARRKAAERSRRRADHGKG